MSILSQLERAYWQYVIKNPGRDACWSWSGRTFKETDLPTLWDADHYTVIGFLYLIRNGAIPDGFSVTTKCGEPMCVRPSHVCLIASPVESV